MSYNGSGAFEINTSGQPVATGQTIDAAVFNALTADLAAGLSTAICKDGQTTVTANIPMAGFKFTGVGIGTATTDAAVVQNVNARSMCEGRLTLTTGVPVTTSDVTAAETLYFTPYKGNCIALYDGTNWVRRTFSELSIDVPDATAVYDVFAYDNSGTVTLELTAWTNTTTRATALTTQDGVLVKTGALTRRYLGTFYCTTAGNGQIEDSAANRYLWNYYNRVLRRGSVTGAAGGNSSYNYTTATVRQADANTAQQINFVIGVSEDAVRCDARALAVNATDACVVACLIGLDSTTAQATGAFSVPASTANVGAGFAVGPSSSYFGYPGVGVHYLARLEYSSAVGTTSWTNAGTTPYNPSAGIFAEIWG